MDMGTHRDLISASHDGECTPEERAVVRQLLEQSEAARVEQRECAQISQLLGQLPEQSAPAGFDAQVLQAVEREMLLGGAPPPAAGGGGRHKISCRPDARTGARTRYAPPTR